MRGVVTTRAVGVRALPNDPAAPAARRLGFTGDWVSLRATLWTVRTAGFLLVGLLTFTRPGSGRFALPMESVAYGIVGACLAAWALVEMHPPAARYRARAMPLILGGIAVAAGFATSISAGSESLVAFAAAAALSAGSETVLAAALTVTAAGILMIEVGGLAYGVGYGTLLGYPMLLIVALLIGRNRLAYRVQADQSAALLTRYEQLQAEQRRGDVLDERTRIAREIHDILAHSLGALGIQIQVVRALLTDHGDTDRAVDALTTAHRMAAEGLVETRRAVHALRVDTLSLDEELARLTDSHRRRYGVAIHLGIVGVPTPLPPEATVALLRTTQEALVNAAKHAGGQEIEVRLHYGADHVRVTVVNGLARARTDAPAAPGTVDGGYGLTGMRERLRLLDGSLRAEPARDPDRWTVTAELPLRVDPQPGNAGS